MPCIPFDFLRENKWALKDKDAQCTRRVWCAAWCAQCAGLQLVTLGGGSIGGGSCASSKVVRGCSRRLWIYFSQQLSCSQGLETAEFLALHMLECAVCNDVRELQCGEEAFYRSQYTKITLKKYVTKYFGKPLIW